MSLPQIEINGVTYTMKKPKARDWTAYAKFEDEKRKTPLIEYVDKLCAFLATQFEGDLTADMLLDNLYLEEVQKAYRDCSKYFWDMLTGKLEDLEKNSIAAEKAVDAQI